MVDASENAHANQSFFTAGKQKGAIDVVWRHAFRAEVSNAKGDNFCAVLADIEKCYEYVRHSDLILQARKRHYPLAILRLSIWAYRSARRLQLHGIISDPIFATQGIIAGSSFATFELKLVMIDAGNRHVAQYPNVPLSIYVDDLVLDCVNES